MILTIAEQPASRALAKLRDITRKANFILTKTCILTNVNFRQAGMCDGCPLGHRQKAIMRHPLRIAMVGLRGVPANYGGIERAVEEIGKRLVDVGHEVEVFCMSSHYASRPARWHGMRLRFLPSVRGKHLEMLAHAALGSAIAASEHFDVVHIHACGPALFALLPRLGGKPVVCTLHGQDWRAPKWGRSARASLKFGEAAACRWATRTTAVSRTYAQYLHDKYGVQVSYIPNGVDQLELRPLNRARSLFGLEPREYVVFVGRLTPGKNVHQLIEAFAAVDTKKKLVIVGGESNANGYTDFLRTLAARDPRVVLTGPLEGELLSEIFNNAFLFAFPTEHEGMPVALLEAMAYGVPTLVSDIPENIEVIEDGRSRCALTCEVGSVDALAAGLREALSAPEQLRELADRAHRLVGQFTWERTAALMLDVYDEVLSAYSRPASSSKERLH